MAAHVGSANLGSLALACETGDCRLLLSVVFAASVHKP